MKFGQLNCHNKIKLQVERILQLNKLAFVCNEIELLEFRIDMSLGETSMSPNQLNLVTIYSLP